MKELTNAQFYNSRRWLRLRESVLRRDGYLCQIAKRYGKIEEAENVHHIFPRLEFPEYQFEAWNLISLSHKAHTAMHQAASGELSPAGIDLLRRTARKFGKPVPEKYS